MTALAGPISEIELPAFEEGVHVHERDGWFYLSFGHRYPQRVAYARSRHPEGPWTVEGILNEVPGNCATNRPAIVAFDGEWTSSTTTACCPAAEATGARCAPTA